MWPVPTLKKARVGTALGWRRRGDKDVFRGREVRWSFAGRSFVINTLNLVAAALFAAMGAVLGVVAATNATVATGIQTSASNWLEEPA